MIFSMIKLLDSQSSRELNQQGISQRRRSKNWLMKGS